MTEKIVQRVFRAEFDVHRSQRIIEGRAVPYGVAERVSDDGVTSYLEEWQMGAFARALLPANMGRVRFQYTHENEDDLGRWIGRTTRLRELKDGLYGEWKVDESAWGDAVLFKVADGQLPGLSISATPIANTARGEIVLRTKAHLRHVAAVPQGAFSDALVTAVRAAQPMHPRADAWRERLAQLKR